jgi:hypothetical protein
MYVIRIVCTCHYQSGSPCPIYQLVFVNYNELLFLCLLIYYESGCKTTKASLSNAMSNV